VSGLAGTAGQARSTAIAAVVGELVAGRPQFRCQPVRKDGGQV